jgi:acetyl-CoA C-acetyltransferase
MKMSEDVFIYDAIRTPRGRGKSTGSLYEVAPIKLAEGLFKELEKRNKLPTDRVDFVVMGCVTPYAEQGGDLPKAAVYNAGWDQSIAAAQINTFCASGLTATNMGAALIGSGTNNLVVTGGIECMSRLSFGAEGLVMFLDPDTSFKHKSVPQGIGADLVATMDGTTREAVDEFALRSQKLAKEAWEKGYFSKSVVPVKDELGRVILDRDEHIRSDTTLEKLAELKPSFEKIGEMGFDDIILSRYTEIESINHVHTAGNSSGIVDGASLILLGTKKIGEELGLRPRARIVATGMTSSDPSIMLNSPPIVTKQVLKKANLTLDQIDLFEINEAFASVVLHFIKETGAPLDKINVNGGAIAMGHPLGATGAMILGTLLDELERRHLRYGLATLCAGGGMGVATIIERVEG